MVTYDEYTALGGKLAEPIFLLYATRAAMYIESITARRSANALGWKLERVKAATASVIDAMAALSDGGAVVTSVSNDGYSESYAVKDADTSLRSAAMHYLSGTGLVGAL